MAGDNVKVEIAHITRNSGGGTTVHRLHPALLQVDDMDEVSAFFGCDMHVLNKPLDIACIETFGKQGIGCHTPFQLLWLFVQILKTV